ncbi:hypothetical protein [Haloplanus sp. C73]|uniref:hypothetical protein n=1 Tax=Haloplanus sp. C73 TaxID=3421641 RepID=UPI003EC1444B
MSPTIEARDDVDGCGCLDCRDVETATVRRSVLDTLVWSARLFRSRPSIALFSAAIVLTNRLLETDSLQAIPTPAVNGLEAATAFAFAVLIRAYVGVVVAGELTDRVTAWEALRRSLARTPALVGVFTLVVVCVLFVPFVLSVPLFVLVAAAAGNPVELVGFPVAAAIGLSVVGVPFLLLLFKFWFAPEACVIGGYGPLKSLRLSWRITTNYRRKFVLVALVVAGSGVGFFLPGSLPEIGHGLAPLAPVLRVVSASAGELLSVVWAGAYAQLYVQGVVD